MVVTMNLANEIRFGPDVEWLDGPKPGSAEDGSDFWEKLLAPSDEKLDTVFEVVRKYLPSVEKDGFSADCT